MGINAADAVWPHLAELNFGRSSFRTMSINVGLRKNFDKCLLIFEGAHDCFSGKDPQNSMKITYPNLKKFFKKINPGNLAGFPMRIVFILYMRLWAKKVYQQDRRFFDAGSGLVDDAGIDQYITEILRSMKIPLHEIDITLAPRNKFLYYLTTCRAIYIGHAYNRAIVEDSRMPFGDMYFFGNRNALRKHIMELEKVAINRNYDFVSLLIFKVDFYTLFSLCRFSRRKEQICLNFRQVFPIGDQLQTFGQHSIRWSRLKNMISLSQHLAPALLRKASTSTIF